MAPTHFLVIPRKPIPTLSATQEEDSKVCALILRVQLHMYINGHVGAIPTYRVYQLYTYTYISLAPGAFADSG